MRLRAAEDTVRAECLDAVSKDAKEAVVQRVARQGADGRMTYAASTDPTAEGSIYFRGSAVADVTRDARWIGRRSFYVEHGDWLVWVCAGWFALAVVLLRGTPAPVAEVAGAEREDSR